MIPERSNRKDARLLLFTVRARFGSGSGHRMRSCFHPVNGFRRIETDTPRESCFFANRPPVKSPPFASLEKYPKIKFDKWSRNPAKIC